MSLDPILTEFTTASPFITSVDFSDFSDGVGYKAYYLMRSKSDAGVVDTLTPSSSFFSYVEQTTQSGIGNTTITFDSSTFNIPRTVKGTAIFNLGYQTQASTSSVEVQLFKWDGSGTTAITSNFTITLADSTDAVISIEMPCTETLIAEGEQLRIVIKTTVPGGGSFLRWGHDPIGRAGTNVTTTSSRINVPFKFDG